MPAWRAGKILWFDNLTGEGVVIDENGKSFYLNEGAINKLRKGGSKKPIRALKENARVKFTTYENAYLVQVDRIK